MKIIGITGSSGAGKSTICEMIQNMYDICLINADHIAKDLSQKESSYVEGIVAIFGKQILNQEGELNRKELADLIYHNSQKRKKLNDYTFQHITRKMREIIEKTDKPIVVIDAPLLFEAELDKICDKTIAIVSKKELQVQRICKRDGISQEMAKKRIEIQQDNDFFRRRCDLVVENTGEIEEMKKQIIQSRIFEV